MRTGREEWCKRARLGDIGRELDPQREGNISEVTDVADFVQKALKISEWRAAGVPTVNVRTELEQLPLLYSDPRLAAPGLHQSLQQYASGRRSTGCAPG